MKQVLFIVVAISFILSGVAFAGDEGRTGVNLMESHCPDPDTVILHDADVASIHCQVIEENVPVPAGVPGTSPVTSSWFTTLLYWLSIV